MKKTITRTEITEFDLPQGQIVTTWDETKRSLLMAVLTADGEPVAQIEVDQRTLADFVTTLRAYMPPATRGKG